MKITSIADACAVLDFLHRRELLCDQCGVRIVAHRNQFNARCVVCKSPNATYNASKVPNELERRIVQSLNEWVSSHPPDQGGASPGDIAPCSSGGPAP